MQQRISGGGSAHTRGGCGGSGGGLQAEAAAFLVVGNLVRLVVEDAVHWVVGVVDDDAGPRGRAIVRVEFISIVSTVTVRVVIHIVTASAGAAAPGAAAGPARMAGQRVPAGKAAAAAYAGVRALARMQLVVALHVMATAET